MLPATHGDYIKLTYY